MSTNPLNLLPPYRPCEEPFAISPASPEFSVFSVTQPPSPQPMPLQTLITDTTLDAAGPEIWVFDSAMHVSAPMLPAIPPRVKTAFPELAWDGGRSIDDWRELNGRRRDGTGSVCITRNHPDGPCHLKATVAAADAAVARGAHTHIVERLKTALLGWSPFHWPRFVACVETPGFKRDTVVELLFPVEWPRATIKQGRVRIVVSQFLLSSLERHGKSLAARADSKPAVATDEKNLEREAACRRGVQAQKILTTAGVSAELGYLNVGSFPSTNVDIDIDVELSVVSDATSLIADLLLNGLAAVSVHVAQADDSEAAWAACHNISVRHCASDAQSTSGPLSILALDADGHTSHEILTVPVYRAARIEKLFAR